MRSTDQIRSDLRFFHKPDDATSLFNSLHKKKLRIISKFQFLTHFFLWVSYSFNTVVN